MKEFIRKMTGAFGVFLCLAAVSLSADAYVVRYISKKANITMAPLTEKLQKKISATTPKEPAASDLALEQPATRISTARLPQGFATDGTYYYYLSQLSTGSDSLRLTRIKYREDGTYESSYMTLKDFGHGTNLDCARVKGKTWIWTGGDSKGGLSTTITCFTFKKGKVLNRHGKHRYRIPASRSGSRYVRNVYPAIAPSGKRLAVRYTRNNRQYFHFYNLRNGNRISPRKIRKKISRKNTAGSFQGFDIMGTRIYTIEGTADRSEMKELNKRYYPTVVRTYDYRTKKSCKNVIKGASGLSHREPEGIQIRNDGKALINMASHYKKLYTCMNIYRAK